MGNKKLLIGIGAGLFVVFLILIILMASGKNNGTNNQVVLGPGTVTLWTPIGDEAAYAPIIEKLQETDTVLNIVAKNPATYEEDLVNAIASGGGPDIFMIKNDWVPKHYQKISPQLYTKSRYSDTAKDFKAMYPAAVANEMIGSGGDIFGYPATSDPLVLYVNQGMIDDYKVQLNNTEDGMSDEVASLLLKPPATWDDFKKVVKLLTVKNGAVVIRSGAALGTSNNINGAQDILYLMMLQNGTSFLSADGKSAVFQLQQKSQRGDDVYPGLNALDLYTSFANPASDVYCWNESLPNALDYFTQGKVGLMIGYASQENYIQQMDPNLNYEVAPLPQVRQTLSPSGFSQYWSWTVNRNSKFKKLSWAVISSMMESKSRGDYVIATKRSPIVLEDLDSKTGNTISGQIYLSKTVYKPDELKYNSIMLKSIYDVTHAHQPIGISLQNAARDITALLQKK